MLLKGNKDPPRLVFSESVRPMPLVEPHQSSPLLRFRSARSEEVEPLRLLYGASWGHGIVISQEQLLAQLSVFPQGQIVGCRPGSDIPVSMINIMLTILDPQVGFQSGYDNMTGNRTFSTHIPPDVVRIKGKACNGLGIALCVSISVLPDLQRHGYAAETLKYAIALAESNDLIAVAYSSPRGFASAREQNQNLSIVDYLHMTEPPSLSYAVYTKKLQRLNTIQHSMTRAFRPSIPIIAENLYDYYQRLKKDSFHSSLENTVFMEFLRTQISFAKMCRSRITVEDFCIITGRRLVDPVMRMHVENGARFIRDKQGNIAAFENSRPEDTASVGYNVLLTYGYHPLLVNF